MQDAAHRSLGTPTVGMVLIVGFGCAYVLVALAVVVAQLVR